jgi:hypothetical protein
MDPNLQTFTMKYKRLCDWLITGLYLRLFNGAVLIAEVIISNEINDNYRWYAEIATDYGLDGQGSNPGREKKCYLLHTIQTGSGAPPSSYPVGIGGCPRG